MTNYDSVLDGRIFESANPVRITSETIADFCAAIGETNPLYKDAAAAKAGPDGGLVAPPSLAAIFGDGENIFRHFPELDNRRLLAGIDVEFLRRSAPETRSPRFRRSRRFTKRPAAAARWFSSS